VETARDILRIAVGRGAAIVLPVDVIVAKELAPNAECRTVAAHDVADDELILDVGPQTIQEFANRLEHARTLVWNGPLGAFETPPFGRGTIEAANLAAAQTQTGQLLSVAGGGDTVAALSMAGVTDKFSYVSTAGGAFLEWLEGHELPGVAALDKSREQ
jgi:phosphoglycerate kinase